MDNDQGMENSSPTIRSISRKQTTTAYGNELPHLLSLRTEATESAPIMMVRKFRPDNRRLYRNREDDIIDKQILSEDIATSLVSE